MRLQFSWLEGLDLDRLSDGRTGIGKALVQCKSLKLLDMKVFCKCCLLFINNVQIRIELVGSLIKSI
jgi:hypothetical protein